MFLLRWWTVPDRDDPVMMVVGPLVMAGAASAILPLWLVVAVWLAATGHYGVRTVSGLGRALKRAWRLADEEKTRTEGLPRP